MTTDVSHTARCGRYVRQLDRRIADLSDGPSGAANGEQTLQEALAILKDCREELGVAEEEMRTQQEEVLRLREEAEDPGTWTVRALDGLPVAVLLLDEHSTVLHANHATGRLLGVPHMLTMGKPMAAFIGLGWRSAFRGSWSEVVKAGGEQHVDVTMRQRGGVSVPVHLVLTAQAELTATRRVRCVAVPCWDGEDGGNTARLARTLAEITSLPASYRDVPELLTRAAKAAASVVPGAAGASISMTNGGSAPALCSSATSRAADRLERELGEGPSYEVARLSQPVVSNRLAADPRWPVLGRRVSALGLCAVAAAPMTDGQRTLGVLTVWAGQGGLPAGCDHLLKAIGRTCASVVQLAQRMEEEAKAVGQVITAP